MTDKITLGDVTSFQNDTTATTIVNSNSSIIQTAFDNTLSRDGTAPNQMEAPLDMNSNQIINLPSPATADSPVRLQDLSTIVDGGTVSNIPAGGSIDQVLMKTGTPDYTFAWEYPVLTGDVTASTSTATTISSNVVTNAKAAQMAAYTLKGNSTSATANAQDLTLAGLPTKTIPASTDLVLIADQSAGGALKTSTVSEVGTSSGVASIDTLTGPFTTSNGITSSGNSLQMTAARRTLPTRQIFTSGSGTYTTPTNCLYIKVTCVGGGGGGASSNGAGVGAGGSSTLFGGIVTAGGGGPGGAGSSQANGGQGGSATGGTLNFQGAFGNTSFQLSALGNSGGTGGGSALFGGGGNASQIGVQNTGGGGCGGNFTGSGAGGGGGGGGGSCILWINSPTTTYSYTVGGGGGGSGASNPGNNGASGIIIVEEFYNS